MTQITLVLPYALPPPELAPDLMRQLKAPALATLLTHASKWRRTPSTPNARALPHELWLAQALGLDDGMAAAAMHGFGLDASEGSWFIVNPAHIQIARTQLMMSDMRQLQLSELDARALFDIAKPYFDDVGQTLLYGDATTWFMRADEWADLQTSSPDTAAGLNLTDWLPTGERALAYRKLQNEVQMLWFEHPVNQAREARKLSPVNSFWPWSPATGARAQAAAPLATVAAPGWLAALATTPNAALPGAIDNATSDTLLYCGSLSSAAMAEDWGTWLLQLQQLDEVLFAPALAAVKKGRVGKLTMVLDRRAELVETSTTALAQRAFWRRPTFNRLLP
jgi:hypothetical protein